MMCPEQSKSNPRLVSDFLNPRVIKFGTINSGNL